MDKNFLDKISFDKNIFLTKFFFGTQIFGIRKFYLNFWATFFVPIWTQNFLDLDFFGPSFFLTLTLTTTTKTTSLILMGFDTIEINLVMVDKITFWHQDRRTIF